ncbi:MAG: transcriptional repressor [Austwickia sp.]|jgi:Fur family ferric uptake transcriptional regulator|nr:transcriptional repressor [Austwickia sp.]MBK8436379.1 transcriptional repressor [Austwickia sp.]MBK9102055.1 transcriptional repressor [Austwickia sp.]
MTSTSPNDPATLVSSLRAKGLRMTTQRERIVAALGALGHATPDAIADAVAAPDLAPLSLSTVYRTLETLEKAGLVSHSHLDQRTPTYHLTDHANHIHLLCLNCGSIDECAIDVVEGLARALARQHSFTVEARHMVIHGWCQACEGDQDDAGPAEQIEEITG